MKTVRNAGKSVVKNAAMSNANTSPATKIATRNVRASAVNVAIPSLAQAAKIPIVLDWNGANALNGTSVSMSARMLRGAGRNSTARPARKAGLIAISAAAANADRKIDNSIAVPALIEVGMIEWTAATCVPWVRDSMKDAAVNQEDRDSKAVDPHAAARNVSAQALDQEHAGTHLDHASNRVVPADRWDPVPDLRCNDADRTDRRHSNRNAAMAVAVSQQFHARIKTKTP